MSPRWDTCQFDLRLVRYPRDPRHGQDRDRNVEVPRWLPGRAARGRNQGIMPLNAMLTHMHTHTHTSRTITHLAQVLSPRTLYLFNPPEHLSDDIGRSEHTMSPMDLVPTLRLAMLHSTLTNQRCCCCSHINSHNQVRGHRIGSSHFGAEERPPYRLLPIRLSRAAESTHNSSTTRSSGTTHSNSTSSDDPDVLTPQTAHPDRDLFEKNETPRDLSGDSGRDEWGTDCGASYHVTGDPTGMFDSTPPPVGKERLMIGDMTMMGVECFG